ncbi:MAG: hypothetical protein HC774_06880 [Sphingomonadales bacterium]|nr:hypothetical protein [Sphingomonadales bacterium]
MAEAFSRLTDPLGVAHCAQGQAFKPIADVPDLTGTALEVQDYSPHGFSVILKLQRPAPGIAHLIGFPIGGPVHISVRFYLYGPEASAVAAEVEAAWQAWLGARFPTGPRNGEGGH